MDIDELLYTGLFSPFYNCKRFRLVLNSSRYSYVNKDIIEFAKS